MDRVEISPSLMTMDLDKFKEQITFLNNHVGSYHIDIILWTDIMFPTSHYPRGLLRK